MLTINNCSAVISFDKGNKKLNFKKYSTVDGTKNHITFLSHVTVLI